MQSPSFEDSFHRHATLGYDPPSDINRLVRCVSHGTPSPLIRWHYHEDFEIHLVVATSGKFFVGNYLGNFVPGNLVLVGPGLPHNWISTDAPTEGVEIRDHCIIFNRAPIEQSAQFIFEMKELLPLLDRASQGIEFFDIFDCALDFFQRIKESTNLVRLGIFFEFLGVLARTKNFRLLSDVFFQNTENEKSTYRTDKIINFITDNYSNDLNVNAVAEYFHMSESHFSRIFRRATGNTFNDFLTRVRINRSCEILVQTNEKISSICYDVGFNNLANFNRRFLALTGITPTAYRMQTARVTHQS